MELLWYNFIRRFTRGQILSDMKAAKKKIDVSIISFNAMGLFNFESLHGILISRNILARLGKTAEILQQKNADIITFQEVHTYSALKLLRKKLTNYPYVIYKKFIYGPRGGLVTFSKFPVEKAEYINFQERGSFRNATFYAHIIKNGILSCKIEDFPLYVMNTYMTTNVDGDYSVNNRFAKYLDAQLKQVAEVMKALAAKKNEIIIAGDFNMAKDSQFYEQFLKLSSVKDIFTNFNTPTQHAEYSPKDKEVKRIDYIFLLNQYAQTTIASAKHLFTQKVTMPNGKSFYLSDHVGLRTDLTFHFPDTDSKEHPKLALNQA